MINIIKDKKYKLVKNIKKSNKLQYLNYLNQLQYKIRDTDFLEDFHLLT